MLLVFWIALSLSYVGDVGVTGRGAAAGAGGGVVGAGATAGEEGAAGELEASGVGGLPPAPSFSPMRARMFSSESSATVDELIWTCCCLHRALTALP